MQKIIDNIKVNYIDEGKGKNVLLLHGWGANIQTMLPIFNVLKSRCRVVALDLPGFGESDEPKEPWNSYDYADFVKKFMDDLGLDDVTLFGHSHGGRISIILSSQYQKQIRKLVLIDSAGLIPKRSYKYYFKVYSFKLMKKFYLTFARGKDKDEKLEKFYKRYGSTDYKAAQGIMRQTMVKVINDNLESLLPSIQAPTLLIWGENDEDTPVYMGKIMEKSIKDSGLIVFEDAGHYSYIDCYAKFKAVIEVFLKDELEQK